MTIADVEVQAVGAAGQLAAAEAEGFAGFVVQVGTVAGFPAGYPAVAAGLAALAEFLTAAVVVATDAQHAVHEIIESFGAVGVDVHAVLDAFVIEALAGTIQD